MNADLQTARSDEAYHRKQMEYLQEKIKILEQQDIIIDNPTEQVNHHFPAPEDQVQSISAPNKVKSEPKELGCGKEFEFFGNDAVCGDDFEYEGEAKTILCDDCRMKKGCGKLVIEREDDYDIHCGEEDNLSFDTIYCEECEIAKKNIALYKSKKISFVEFCERASQSEGIKEFVKLARERFGLNDETKTEQRTAMGYCGKCKKSTNHKLDYITEGKRIHLPHPSCLECEKLAEGESGKE